MVVISLPYIALSFFISSSGLVQGVPDIPFCNQGLLANTSETNGTGNLTYVFPALVEDFFDTFEGWKLVSSIDNLFYSTTQRFDPFNIGSYTFNGGFTPSERFPSDWQTAHGLFEEAQAFLTDVHDISVHVRRGQRLTYHSGTDDELEISFIFPMEGGPPFTYASVNTAINTLRQGLQQRHNIDAHPIDITISQGSRAKIKCHISKPTNWNRFKLETETPLTMTVFAWPSRRLDARAVRSVLASAKTKILHAGRPMTMISERFSVSEVVRNVMAFLAFAPSLLPPVQYGEVYELIDDIDDHLGRGGSYCEIYGTLEWDDASRHPVHIGFFKLAPSPNDRVLATSNSTWMDFNARVALLAPSASSQNGADSLSLTS